MDNQGRPTTENEFRQMYAVPDPYAVCDDSTWYINHYDCPCGESWDDEWDCMCNDKCPSCNKEIQPTSSEEI